MFLHLRLGILYQSRMTDGAVLDTLNQSTQSTSSLPCFSHQHYQLSPTQPSTNMKEEEDTWPCIGDQEKVLEISHETVIVLMGENERKEDQRSDCFTTYHMWIRWHEWIQVDNVSIRLLSRQANYCHLQRSLVQPRLHNTIQREIVKQCLKLRRYERYQDTQRQIWFDSKIVESALHLHIYIFTILNFEGNAPDLKTVDGQSVGSSSLQGDEILHFLSSNLLWNEWTVLHCCLQWYDVVWPYARWALVPLLFMSVLRSGAKQSSMLIQ